MSKFWKVVGVLKKIVSFIGDVLSLLSGKKPDDSTNLKKL